MLPLEQPAVGLCVFAAGLFFAIGLLTGSWKYLAIARSPNARAPVYVDIAHRAALMYSFAAILLAVFAAHSAWSARTNLLAAAAPLIFFALAIGSYIIHGLFDVTDNAFEKPHRFGPVNLPGAALHGFMIALMLAEIGGFAVLFAGVILSLTGS